MHVINYLGQNFIFLSNLMQLHSDYLEGNHYYMNKNILVPHFIETVALHIHT